METLSLIYRVPARGAPEERWHSQGYRVSREMRRPMTYINYISDGKRAVLAMI